MKIFLLIFFTVLTACAKNFDKGTIQPVENLKLAKVPGKHSVFIPKNKFNIEKKYSSEDCESWSVKLDFDKPFKDSIKLMLDKMIDNYVFSEKKLSSKDIESKGFVSQISFEDFYGISNFKTEKNTGKYNISLKVTVKVENSNKNITNEISSDMNWDKNIFLNCDLQDGALKSGQRALNNIIKKVYESIYESSYKLVR